MRKFLIGLNVFLGILNIVMFIAELNLFSFIIGILCFGAAYVSYRFLL